MTFPRTGTRGKFELRRCEAEKGGRFLVIGDVQDVLYSRAKRVRALPSSIRYGFGLLSDDGPSGAGEGIVIRGLAALTPPSPAAGRLIKSCRQPTALETPFFLGWHGEPSAVGRFQSDSSVTLNSIFEWIFRQVEPEPSPLIYLEMAALFRVSDIQDRALCKPIHTGNIMITDESAAGHYFLFSPIGSELSKHEDPLLVLVIAGVGFRPSGIWENETEIAKSIFYEPPRLDNLHETNHSRVIRTHIHALAWVMAENAVTDLPSVLSGVDLGSVESEMDKLLEGLLLPTKPSHLVHLDDGSSPLGGLFRAFIPHREEMEILRS